MKKNLFELIIEHLLGRKYWLVVLEKIEYSNPNAQDTKKSVSNFIFDKKEDAKQYYYSMKNNRTYNAVEIVSFRSNNKYYPFNNDWRL